MTTLATIDLPLPLLRRGKVREVFEVTARVLREPRRDRPYIVMWPGSRPSSSNDQPERRQSCSSP